MTYWLTPRARLGVELSLQRIERQFGARVAERTLDDFVRAFETIASHPSIGRRWPSVTADPSVRFWTVGPSIIAYRANDRGVEILVVERGERDWNDLLTGADDDTVTG